MGDNLRNRGFNFVDWCIMCCCGETIDHLLLHCRGLIGCGALSLDLLGFVGFTKIGYRFTF